MKNKVPVYVTILIGLVYLAQNFVRSEFLDDTTANFNNWIVVLAAASVVLGVISLFQHHFKKIRKRERQWYYSIVTLVSMCITSFLGLVYGIDSESFDWIVKKIFFPLRATMFSLLAFYLASAAFRAFRIRSLESTLLLLTAVVVMFGRIPVGENCWSGFGACAQWIIDNPTTAAVRAITMGIGLGMLALSIRILIGKEKSHLG